MPEEEKKDLNKFKAVTEELTVDSPSEHVIQKPQEKNGDVKGFVSVPETDNIGVNSEIRDRGAFLKIFLVTFFATLLAFLLAGGIYVYLTGVKGVNTKNVTVQTPVPTTSTENLINQTPAPTPNIDVSTYKVSVLNGNGGIGVATALKNIIEKVGFKVTYTGNADNFNFTDTLVQVKSSVLANVVAKLKDSLSSNYSIRVGDILSPESNFDIVITVGSK